MTFNESLSVASADPDTTLSERGPRTASALRAATRAFASEFRAKSRREAVLAFALLGAMLGTAAFTPWWPLRTAAALLASLAMVRCFALYHDFLHGAILTRSTKARWAFYAFGVIVLTPPRSWRASHNAHHADVGQIERAGVGSFPLMTVDAWRVASWRERFRYRISRHPLNMLFAYVTIFVLNICLAPLLRRPSVHWDSALTILAHAALAAGLWGVGGAGAAFFGLLLPAFVASAMGGCLFYVQHSFPGLGVAPAAQWSRDRAALESSSCLRLPPVLRWITGNLGFHHVHHLNPQIPFYRLPEAMAGIPELGRTAGISLRMRDFASCFATNLWDETRGRMVPYRAAAADVGAAGSRP